MSRFTLGPPVYSTYVFDPSASVPFIYGALHLSWGPTSVASTERTRGPAPPPEEEEANEVEHKIEAAMNQLPTPQRQ